METTLSNLEKLKPLKPRGWFHWIHFHFAGRYPVHDKVAQESTQGKALIAVEQNWRDGHLKMDHALLTALEKHAWLVGRLDFVSLAETIWDHLQPLSRGSLLAGLSENFLTGKDYAEWIAERLASAQCFPEAHYQLACNLIWKGRIDLLEAILSDSPGWKAHVWRGDKHTYPDTHWPNEMALLSRRLIDLVLEAAVVCRREQAVALALKFGANPNLPLWVLERSFNERPCALGYAISEELRGIATLLVKSGADVKGANFGENGSPLYFALSKGWHDLAEILLAQGASFAKIEPFVDVLPDKAGAESEIILPKRHHFGHSQDELNWARKQIGSVVPLASIVEKATFYFGNAQGGYHSTFLNAVVGDLPRLRHYESLGMDTRLTTEELCSAINADAYDGLVYLLSKHGPQTRDRALFRIRRRKPNFGAVFRELEAQPQADGTNLIVGFDPQGQPPLELEDGTRLYVDLEAIAPPGHSHGPCLEGHFWLRHDKATYRRRQDRVVMTRIVSRWTMTALPQNQYQLDDLLPSVREIDSHYITLGVALGKLSIRTRNRATSAQLYAVYKSPAFPQVLAEAQSRINAQDAANLRPPSPQLSQDELNGYPTVFWPYLIRLANGYIGMTSESSREQPGILDIYNVWSHQNKREDSFVPDPRIQDWLEATSVPLELRPFFHFDPLFDRPGTIHKANSSYEEAMVHKTTRWWNDWMKPQILAALEEHSKK